MCNTKYRGGILKLDFKKNLGTTDRVIRICIGLLLIAFAFILTGWLETLAIILAILLIIGAAFGYCIVYDLIGWSTRK